MSKLFSLIQSQVDNLFKFNVQTEQGLILPAWVPHQMYLRPMINLISAIFFLIIVLMFGKFLWNQGIVSVFNIALPIGGEMERRAQLTAYPQLIVTLMALMMIM